MPALVCPRCQRTNPDLASYCYFDGVALRTLPGSDGHLPRSFTFPTGRVCHSYDELAQGCQEEWAAARDLLKQGVFSQFFASCGRADLMRAADETRTQPNPDIALASFLGTLPGSSTNTPKLDLSPRRLLIGTVLIGETRKAQLTITNQAQGTLQGTVAVTEGQDWLSLAGDRPLAEIAVRTPRQQLVTLYVQTQSSAAGQTYGAKLTVVTNGGVVEVPLRLDVAAQPFGRAPYQGVKTQRELAQRMRAQPKAAGPLLESGEVKRWFALNGWTYPVSGPDMTGLAAVQQFFEALGLSKPPILQLSPPDVRVACTYLETLHTNVTLSTVAKKWVYAHASSDTPWLKVLTPHISGAQKARLQLEIETRHWTGPSTAEGQVKLLANAGQSLTLPVRVEVSNLPKARPPKPPGQLLSAVLTMALCFLLLRLVMVPLADLGGRATVAQAAAARLNVATLPDSPITHVGGWLQLPWLSILAGGSDRFPATSFQNETSETLSTAEFRHYFASYFLRYVVLRVAWIGTLLGAVLIVRRGGWRDLPWGLVAGSVAGLVGGATLASGFLVVEMLPHAVWVTGFGRGFGAWVLWLILALVGWTLFGLAFGLVCCLFTPLRRVLVQPMQRRLTKLFRLCGLRGLADFWLPEALQEKARVGAGARLP